MLINIKISKLLMKLLINYTDVTYFLRMKLFEPRSSEAINLFCVIRYDHDDYDFYRWLNDKHFR